MKSTATKGNSRSEMTKNTKQENPVLRIAQDSVNSENAIEESKNVLPTSENVGESQDKKESQNVRPIEKEVKSFVQSLQPSAEERIKRVRNFEILSDRFNFLKSKADELNRFLLQNAQTNAKLIFRNQATGADFEISNSFVIAKALGVASEELKILLADTENEVVNFEI